MNACPAMLLLTSGFFRLEDAYQWRDITKAIFKWPVNVDGDAPSVHQGQIVRPVMGVWSLQTTSVNASQDITINHQQKPVQDVLILVTGVTAHIVVAVYSATQRWTTDI